MSEGIRTPDRRDHNPELYQLSYAHRGWQSAYYGRAWALYSGLGSMLVAIAIRLVRLYIDGELGDVPRLLGAKADVEQ